MIILHDYFNRLLSGGKWQKWFERISASYIFVRSIIPHVHSHRSRTICDKWITRCLWIYVSERKILIFVKTIVSQGKKKCCFLLFLLNTIVLCRYESPWYTFSPRIRSLYVLSLRSCLNFPTLTAGGLIVLNLQSFAEVIYKKLVI